MRLLIAGLALALMMASAQAQLGTPQGNMNNNAQLGQHAANSIHASESEGQKVKANDKAYNAALKNLPDKQFDPWHGVR
jgi:hypothetical protein